VDKARTAGAIAVDPDVLAGLRTRYDQAVAWGIATHQHRDWPTGRHPGHTLATRLPARAKQVWRFTVDFAVPFTNNPAEQPQRMVKLQMKIGGCWRSVHTAARYCQVPVLPGHRPQPRRAPTRRPPRRPGRQPLDATTNRLINHRREWIRGDVGRGGGHDGAAVWPGLSNTTTSWAAAPGSISTAPLMARGGAVSWSSG